MCVTTKLKTEARNCGPVWRALVFVWTRYRGTMGDIRAPPFLLLQGCHLLQEALLFALYILLQVRQAGVVVKSTTPGAIPRLTSPGHTS